MMKIISILFHILPLSVSKRILIHLTGRVKRYRLQPEERLALDQSEKFEYDNGKYAYRWGEGPLIVFVHGWAGAAGQWSEFALQFQKQGYCAVAFDATAHGASTGNTIKFSHFSQDLKTLLSHLNEQPYAIIGHSAGGLGTLASRSLEGVSTKRFVCITTPDSLYPPVKVITSMVPLPTPLVEQLKNHLALQFNSKWEDITKNIFYHDNDSRYFFIYDEDDKYLNGNDSANIKLHLPTMQEFTIDAGGHVKILKSKKVIEEVLAFLKE